MDVDQVTALSAVAVDRERFTPSELPLEFLQGEIRALAIPPHCEEPQGREVQTVESRVEPAPLFGVELGQGVGTARVAGGGLRRGALGVWAVDGRGGCEDESLDGLLPAELEKPDCAEHVGFFVVDWAVDGWPHTGQGGEVHDATEGAIGKGILADVAVECFDWARVVLGRGPEVEGGDLVAEGSKVSDDVLTDEAGRASNEN